MQKAGHRDWQCLQACLVSPRLRWRRTNASLFRKCESFPKSWAILPPQVEIVNTPLTGYILVSFPWSPQFARSEADDKKNAAQCKGPGKFGFVLHGLWPDGAGLNDPKWCKRVSPVSAAVLKQNFCATPSAGLMQYEWAKHGAALKAMPNAILPQQTGNTPDFAFRIWRRFPVLKRTSAPSPPLLSLPIPGSLPTWCGWTSQFWAG